MSHYLWKPTAPAEGVPPAFLLLLVWGEVDEKEIRKNY